MPDGGSLNRNMQQWVAKILNRFFCNNSLAFSITQHNGTIQNKIYNPKRFRRH
jgi:hypothetical protein